MQCGNSSKKSTELKSKTWSRNGANCAGTVLSQMKMWRRISAPNAGFQGTVEGIAKCKIGKSIRRYMLMLTVFKWTNKNRIFRISNIANPDPWLDKSIMILIHNSSMNLFKRHARYFISLMRVFSICIVFKIIQKSRTFFLKIN